MKLNTFSGRIAKKVIKMRYIKLLFFLAVISTGLFGCSKGCNFPEDEFKGAIIDGAVIYPSGGYLTDLYPNGMHMTGTTQYADKVEIKLPGEQQRVPFTSIAGSYHILAYKTTVKCDVQFVREVLIDHPNQTVIYNIGIKECDKGCDDLRGVENYVLVPAFPTNYSLIVNVQ